MLRVDVTGLDRLREAVGQLEHLDQRSLLEDVGAEVVRQTKHRLSVSKRDPFGRKWKPWSPSYARSRRGSNSLLEGKGQLLDSIESQVFGVHVDVGTRFDSVHQGGRGQIPARPYLGIGPDDEDDILEVIGQNLNGQLREAGLL